MNLNRILILISIIFVLFMAMGAISANDSSNCTSIGDNFNDSSDVMSDFEGNTITIEADENNFNQSLNPSVQSAIDESDSGDTIILKGNFSHCIFTINKTLTVIGDSGASLGSSPHQKHENVDEFCIFYITGDGSGSLIKGFSFNNDEKSKTPFSFLIRGASDVSISDCTMNFYNPESDKISGIIIENSNGINLSNLVLNNTIYGIRLINSTNVNIVNCTFMNNENYAVSISGDSRKIRIADNVIVGNGLSGINLTSADNVYIINNFIKNNGLNDVTESGSGIYVNTNITKLVVKGNILMENSLHAIMYDYRVRNLDNTEGADELSIVDNNYFAGHSSMILHHRTYVPNEKGNLIYDEVNDVFSDVGFGNYIESKSYVYMRNAFVCEGEVVCGFTYYTTHIPWTLNAPANNGVYDLSLALSNITQIKKGIYQVSVIDKKGNVAKDLSSFDVSFYLSNISSVDDNKIGYCKVVKIQNGTAVVDFRDVYDKFCENGSFITASFPGVFKHIKGNPYVQLFVNSSDIPNMIIPTQISIEKENIVFGWEKCSAVLTDVFGKALSEKSINILINGKSSVGKTDSNGRITFSINGCGSYDVTLCFSGDDEYSNNSITNKINVLKRTPKLTYSQLTTFPLSDEYFKVKLTDNNGNILSGQKITFKINGKTFSSKTDSKGIAKIKVSLTTKKSYQITVSYSGSATVGSISKTGKIIVKTGLKKSSIKASNIKVKRNAKKSFSLKLTSSGGKAIAKQKVTVKLNGKSYSLKTNSKGIAKLTVKFTSVKKYKVTMKFLGNSNFKATSKTSTITVTRK